MRKRICSVLISMLLLIYCLPSAFAAMENFKVQRLYANRFTDVPAKAWYQPSVAEVYELGLMNGKSTYQFQPDGMITVAETIALAARIHATYYGNKIYLTEGQWYAPYVHYAEQNGIVNAGEKGMERMQEPISRALFARILYASLPASEFKNINTITVGSIPDVATGETAGDAVYALYSAGILTGSDAVGHFLPKALLTRAQGTAILARMVNEDLRQHFVLSTVKSQ